MSAAKRKIVVGITGASGAPYAKRLIEILGAREDVELAVCASSTAPEVWALECGGVLREEVQAKLWDLRDYRAPFASGSAGWHAMAIVPCSMGTVARVAHGISDTLLTRAADVMLKERRTLVVVPRESPLSVIHLENLTTLARAGAMVLPAMPSFYRKPKTMDDLVDSVVARVVDHLGIDANVAARWGLVSALVLGALRGAGLSDVDEARSAGDLARVRDAAPRLASADLLTVGALADRVRAREVGDEVRVYANVPADDGDDVVTVRREGKDALAFLRHLAVARITGAPGARVRVDWTEVGLELAQVALGFGANELAGVITTRRGLPIADGDMAGTGKKSARVSAKLVKQRELAGFIERSGRRATFVGGEEA